MCEYTACRLLNGRLFQFLFRLFPDLFVQIGQCQCIGEFTHSFYGEIKIIHAAGHLSASAIKRNHDIKDYGKIIPGHGGIMDRFDSVLFTAPVIYFLSVILLGAVH